MKTYRFCDNVWTFVMENVEFKEVTEVATVDKVKFVACDGRAGAAGWSSSSNTTRCPLM